jgi:amidohydrolase
MPNLSVDPILAASQIVVALQSLVSREVSPFSPTAVTVGSIHGGTAFNIIPDEVVLEGTFRAYSEADRTHLETRIKEVAESVGAAMRASVDVEMVRGCPPCVSDANMARLVERAAAETVGAHNIRDDQLTTGSDDMALFLDAVPGCYFIVGVQNQATGCDAPHHSPRFKIDEGGLPVGVEVMVRAALDYLQ